MIIYLKKFGTTLVSRQAGREAFAALQPLLREQKNDKMVEIDFEGVITFAPSWGDEFLTPLLKKYKENLLLKNTDNSSVRATLKMLEKINGIIFKFS